MSVSGNIFDPQYGQLLMRVFSTRDSSGIAVENFGIALVNDGPGTVVGEYRGC